MKPLKEKISITIDSDILEKIRFQAENDDRSLSQYINIILKEHIKNFRPTPINFVITYITILLSKRINIL